MYKRVRFKFHIGDKIKLTDGRIVTVTAIDTFSCAFVGEASDGEEFFLHYSDAVELADE